MIAIGRLTNRQSFVSLLKANNAACVSARFLHLSLHCCSNEEGDLERNPFFEKYADKIKHAQSSGTHAYNEDRLCNQLAQETKKWKDNIEKAEKTLHAKKDKQSTSRGSKLPSKLNDLIHMELFEGKSVDEVTNIWTEHFKTKEAISAVIPADVFNLLLKKSRDFPMFLYPLPRDLGYEFILSQFDGNRCFFTSLISYQVHNADAPWQLCLTFYSELMKSKGIVLMASEIDLNGMNILEAQCLAQLQQMFYADNADQSKNDLLHKFNHNPSEFKYMDVVNKIESSNLVVKPNY